MKVSRLKKLLKQFNDDDTIRIANYNEEDSDGNMPIHEIKGAEFIDAVRGSNNQKERISVIFFKK